MEIRCNCSDVTKYLLSKDKNTYTPNSTVSIPDEKSHAFIICNKSVHINIHKLDLKNALSIKLSLELLKKLYDKTDYDSDKREDYWPMAEDYSNKFKAVLVNKPANIKDIKIPLKRIIKSKPSKGGFKYSIHSVKRHRHRTYLSCKIGCCKTKFASVKAWNSQHRRVHRGQKLECSLCNKEFKTPSFLCDHRYMHSDKAFKCHLCSKVIAFKSTYQVHQ